MSTKYGPVVPEGQYPPFAVVTPDDQSAWILIAAALGLVCSLFFGGLRFFVRLTIDREFGLDDFILGAATVLAVIQSSIILIACSKGLGKSIDLLSLGAQNEVQGMYYASNLFFIIILGLSKISVVAFLLRLSPYKHHHKLVFKSAIVVLVAWTAGSFIAVALQCSLEHAWLSVNEDCTGTVSSDKNRSEHHLLTICSLTAPAMEDNWRPRHLIGDRYRSNACLPGMELEKLEV